MRLSHQIFAISFVVSAVALSLVGAHTVDEISKILNQQSLDAMKSRVEREARAFDSVIKTMNSDLALLASTDPVKRLPSTWVPYARQTIERTVQDLFYSLLIQRPFYAQLRLLGPNGMELVRVNQGPDGRDVVDESLLQDKSDRPYFQKAMRLSIGQVHLSRLDLNQERGEIVKPHQPVLRAAIPVIEGDGALLGVLVINLDVKTVMGDFETREGHEELILLNTKGDYLIQDDHVKTFGFEFGETWRLPVDHGLEHAWARWTDQQNDSVEAHFLTDSHLLAMHKVRLRSVGIFPEEPNLVLAIRDSLDHFAAQRAAMREHFWITLTIICILLAFILGLITHKITRPLKALAETTQRITDGDQDLRADVAGSLEMRRLSVHLNTMLEALKRSARDKQMATLGRMAAMVAHDLRNALTSVKVNLQVLARNQSDDNPMQEERFDIALEQVQMMEKVLQEILVFARAESLQTDWEEPASIIRATMITVMPMAAERNINLDAQGLESLPQICCDRTKLVQVFRNLIDNALAISPPEGTIQILGNLISDDDRMAIEVQIIDQGPGIDPEVCDTLFEPFVTTRPRGTGLGLAIVKRVIGLHGGTITLEDGPIQGAIATVTLPVQAACKSNDDDDDRNETDQSSTRPLEKPETEPPIAARTSPAE